MKWNATNVSAACLAVGLGGFVAGKLTSSSGSGSEADALLARSQQVSNERTSANRDAGSSRRDTASRKSRSGGERSTATMEERLASMEEIVRGENALDRSRAMLSWIDSLAPSEFEEAVAKFRSLGITEDRMGEYAMLLTAWAEVDPTTALAYTMKNTTGGMATSTVLAAWASRDPESAVAWAEANHEGEGANPFMVDIIRSIAATNPTRATVLLQALPYSGERGRALEAMMPHLLKNGTEAAKAWITSLSDVRLRNGAIARFAPEMAKTDPAGAASWLLANLSEASTRSVDEVFGHWAETDKDAAAASFTSLPQGDARSRALRGLVTVVARKDPQAGANLMNRYPADVDDRMVFHFVWESYDKAPSVAVGQIADIKNVENRNRMYQRALSTWLDRDYSTAQRWISSANLPQEVMSSLANKISP